MPLARVHLVVTGRVQGVAFRAYTVEEARRLGVSGWVRNLADGRVEVEAEGERAALRSLARWCEQGPPAARVDRVDPEWTDWRGDLGPFSARH